MGGGIVVLKPPTTTTTAAGTRRRTGPFSKPQRGDEGWGGEGTRPPGAPSHAPSFNFHLDSLQTGQPLWQVKKPHSAMYVQPMLLVWIFIMNNIFITPQTVNETLTDCKIPVHSLIMNCFFNLLNKSVPYLIWQYHLVWYKCHVSVRISIHWKSIYPSPSPPVNAELSALFGLSSSVVLYKWLSWGLCDIIAILPGGMTFHRLRTISELIVAGQEGENYAYTCAVHDKRFAVALFVLYRPTEG